MEIDVDKLLAVIKEFNRERVDYVLIGGAAVNLHGLIRGTEDFDFFIRPAAENVERVKRALRSVWDDPSIDDIQPADVQEYSTVRYGSPDESVVIDLIGNLGEMFSFDAIESEVAEVSGIPVRIATPRMLYRMKRDTIRSKDRMDADALRRRFRLED